MSTLDRFKGLPIHTEVSRTLNGSKYLTFCVGGIVEEGYEIGHWCTSGDDVVHLFNRRFDEYATQNRGKKVLWRRLPEIISKTLYEDLSWSGDRLEVNLNLKPVIVSQVIARFVYE